MPQFWAPIGPRAPAHCGVSSYATGWGGNSGVLEHKRGNISETRKSYYGELIGSHQRSFEQYHPRPPTASSSLRLGVRNPHPKLQSLLSQERVKLQTSNLAHIFTVSIRTKALKNLGKKRAWAYPGTAEIFWIPSIISGTGKATNFKFCTIITKAR